MVTLHAAMPTSERGDPAGAELRRGFLAMVPLWAGVVPFGIAYAILAREAGFSALEAQALSAFVFAGAAQMSMVTLVAAGAGPVALVATALLVNLRHLLYGMSLGRIWGARTRPRQELLAAVMTDEAYGLTVRDRLERTGSPWFFAGAALSLYGAYNLATLAGSVAGGLVPDAERLGLDFVFPLTFVALLLPLLRDRRRIAVAAIAAAAMALLSQLLPGGLATLVAATIAAALGVRMERGRPRGAGGA